MNKQQILNNLISVATFVNVEVGCNFNTAVVKLGLEGENTFDIDLLLQMVTASGFMASSEIQKKAIDFVIENILTKRNTTKQPYIPSKLGEEWPCWAVDSNGGAFYYKDMPKQRDVCWDVDFGALFKRDMDFEREDYKEMFKDDNWKNTLQTWKGPRDYVPVFTGDSREWAIDKCGDAYYYDLIIGQTSTTWAGNVMTYDTKFDKEKFEHMWRNGVWKTSKITK